MNMYYLAYGSNLNIEQMKLRCPSSVIVGKTMLKNYRLVYKGSANGYAYLTIQPEKGSYVPLGIYKVSLIDKGMLDHYEGFPRFYQKKYFDIEVDGEIVNAFLYIMNPQFSYHTPTQKYIDICMQGYKDFGFSQDLLEEALEFTKQNLPKSYKK